MDSVEIPYELVEREVERIHSGNCPVCKGPGPVDLYHSRFVVSCFVVCQSGSSSALSCRPCRNKQWLKDTTVTLFMGWWGVPHGIVRTPITLVRNGWEFYCGPKASKPSTRLIPIARSRLDSAVAEACQSALSLECPRCKAGYSLTGIRDGVPDIRCRSCGNGLQTESPARQAG